MESKKNVLSSLYLLSVIVFMPLLGLYNFPATGVNFMNITLMLILIIGFISRIYVPLFKIDLAYVPLLIYLPAQTIYACFYFNIDEVKLILSAGQYIAFIFLLTFFNRELFNAQLAKKIVIFIADIACIYILIQQIAASVFGFYIGAGIPFLEVSNDVIANYTDAIEKYNLGYRPRSLFSEPAMFSTYIILPFILMIYEFYILKIRKKTTCIRIVLYFIGLLISRSTLGFIASSSALLFCGIYFCSKNKIKLSLIQLIEIFIIISIIICLTQTTFVQFQIERLFYGDILNEERMKFLSDFTVFDMTTWEKFLFGHDFSLLTYTGEYLPSFFRQLYCFGVMGEVFLILFLILVFLRSYPIQIIILLTFIVLMFGSEIIHGVNFLYYFIWLLPINQDFFGLYRKNDLTGSEDHKCLDV